MDLSDEETRILRAAEIGSLRMNEDGRYVIDGDRRPERKARERLQRLGLIGDGWHGRRVVARVTVEEVAVHGSTD